MSLINAYSEIVQQSIDVDLMDTKNVGNIILGYADYSYSQKFLCKFFDFFNKVIEKCVYLNEEKTKWYLDDESFGEFIVSYLKYKTDLGRYFGAVSIDEKEIVKVLSIVIIRTKNQGEKYYIGMNPRDGLRRAFEALFDLKINKKMAIATNRFSHNNDSRSVKSVKYMKRMPFSLVNCTFNFENNKYVKYFSGGFTLKEYVSEYLQIRGNPYDRWYTLYCGTVIPSEEQLEKVNKIINDDEVKITSENCILFNIDFGS